MSWMIVKVGSVTRISCVTFYSWSHSSWILFTWLDSSENPQDWHDNADQFPVFMLLLCCSLLSRFALPLSDNHCRNSTYEKATLDVIIACVGVFMGSGNNYAILRQLCPLPCIGHMVHVFPLYLNCSTGCPSHGSAISTWLCMCLLRNWTAEGMLAWDWWSSGIMRKAPLFVGPLVHRDLTLWGLACVGWGYCPSFFPPPFFLLSLTVMHQRGGRKWLFIDEHAQELIEEESQSAGYKCLSWAIPQQPVWMLPSDSLLSPMA